MVAALPADDQGAQRIIVDIGPRAGELGPGIQPRADAQPVGALGMALPRVQSATDQNLDVVQHRDLMRRGGLPVEGARHRLVDAAELEEVQAQDDSQENGDDTDGDHGAAPERENKIEPALASGAADRKRQPR